MKGHGTSVSFRGKAMFSLNLFSNTYLQMILLLILNLSFDVVGLKCLVCFSRTIPHFCL